MGTNLTVKGNKVQQHHDKISATSRLATRKNVHAVLYYLHAMLASVHYQWCIGQESLSNKGKRGLCGQIKMFPILIVVLT